MPTQEMEKKMTKIEEKNGVSAKTSEKHINE